MTTHKFSLDDNFSIQMIKNDEGKNVYLVDNILGTTRLIGTLSNSCKWIFPSPQIQNEFFKLVSQYKSIFMNNFYNKMENIREVTLDKQITCFRRRMHIKVVRTLNKLKHVI